MRFLTEKEKAKLEHKFKIHQIILDKVLWGVVVVLFVFTTNYLLENYKAKLTSERFFLEEFNRSTYLNQGGKDEKR